MLGPDLSPALPQLLATRQLLARLLLASAACQRLAQLLPVLHHHCGMSGFLQQQCQGQRGTGWGCVPLHMAVDGERQFRDTKQSACQQSSNDNLPPHL